MFQVKTFQGTDAETVDNYVQNYLNELTRFHSVKIKSHTTSVSPSPFNEGLVITVQLIVSILS